MKKTVFILSLVFFACLTFALQQKVDVTGDWEITMETQRGTMTSSVSFVQKGEKLTVTMTSPRGDETKGEGTVKENKIEWTIVRTTQRGEMTMTYTGTVEGDTMKGEVQFGNFGSSEWTAKRKKSS